MISAVCGKGAILAVEQNVRGKVEFQLLDSLSHEPFELKQLVRNHIEKANLLKEFSSSPTSNTSFKSASFIREAKAALARAVRADRVALLSNPEEYDRQAQLDAGMVSPTIYFDFCG
jgi:hypothetical protein